jgi:integral membrane protein
MVSSASGARSVGSTGAFRAVAYLEAATYLVLLGFVVLHRVLDGPDLVRVPGLVHGLVFLVYLALVLRIREGQGWGLWRTLVVVLLSAVPFGGFWAGHDLADDDERAVAAG